MPDTVTKPDPRSLLALDQQLGPQINWKLLSERLANQGARNDISAAHFAGIAGIAGTTFNALLLGKEVPSLRLRYKVAWTARRLGLDPDHEIAYGDDGLVNYAPKSSNGHTA